MVRYFLFGNWSELPFWDVKVAFYGNSRNAFFGYPTSFYDNLPFLVVSKIAFYGNRNAV
jgi:hypothetical protein